MSQLDYAFQDEAVTAVMLAKCDNPLVVAPTGSGKSHIIAKLVKRIWTAWPKSKILVLSHVQEILDQDYTALCKYNPARRIGIYSSGLNSRDVADCTVGGIQSAVKQPRLFKNFDWVLVDEAHSIPPSGTGRYLTLLEAIKPNRVVGFTATPFRMGSGYLVDSPLFDNVVYNIEIIKLIEQGYLSPLTSKRPGFELDTTDIKLSGGDFNQKHMSEKLDKNEITEKICDELAKYKTTRKKWLIFAIDIAHCEHIANALVSRGITADFIHSRMVNDRTEVVRFFREGHFQCLVSVQTVTTGFDVTDIDMIVLARPTRSPVLHVQMIGRGLRIAPNKKDCLVLDFAGNLMRLGPINAVEIPDPKKKKRGPQPPRMKECPSCSELVAPAVRVCPVCEHEFEFQYHLGTEADTESAVLFKPEEKFQPKIVDVHSVTYSVHKKAGKIPTLKITYRCGLQTFNEWIAFEHGGYPKVKARNWWHIMQANKDIELPDTVAKAFALKDTLKKPKRITLLKLNKYPEIVNYGF